MSTKPSAGKVLATYEFIKAHRDEFSVQTMCRVLGVAPSSLRRPTNCGGGVSTRPRELPCTVRGRV